MIRPRTSRRLCRGQALAEGLLGLSVLGILFLAIPVVGRYQAMALTSVQVSAHGAFLSTRQDFSDGALASAATARAADAASGRWRDAAGRALSSQSAGVSQSRRALAEGAQPGGAAARALRQGWALEDEGMRVVGATVAARDVTPRGGALAFSRATAILAGAGHAETPAAVQARVAGNGPAWRAAQAMSRVPATAVAARSALIDAAWRRPMAGTDWVSAWADQVPADRVTRPGP